MPDVFDTEPKEVDNRPAHIKQKEAEETKKEEGKKDIAQEEEKKTEDKKDIAQEEEKKAEPDEAPVEEPEPPVENVVENRAEWEDVTE